MNEFPVGSVWERHDGSRTVFVVLEHGVTSHGTAFIRFLVLDSDGFDPGEVEKLSRFHVRRHYERIDL